VFGVKVEGLCDALLKHPVRRAPAARVPPVAASRVFTAEKLAASFIKIRGPHNKTLHILSHHPSCASTHARKREREARARRKSEAGKQGKTQQQQQAKKKKKKEAPRARTNECCSLLQHQAKPKRA
jgi:hypothetical protein